MPVLKSKAKKGPDVNDKAIMVQYDQMQTLNAKASSVVTHAHGLTLCAACIRKPYCILLLFNINYGYFI